MGITLEEQREAPLPASTGQDYISFFKLGKISNRSDSSIMQGNVIIKSNLNRQKPSVLSLSRLVLAACDRIVRSITETVPAYKPLFA